MKREGWVAEESMEGRGKSGNQRVGWEGEAAKDRKETGVWKKVEELRIEKSLHFQNLIYIGYTNQQTIRLLEMKKFKTF